MNNKQILDNAPDDATHVSLGITTSYLKINQYTFWFDDGNWRLLTYARTGDIHSLSDLRKILELEERIAELEREQNNIKAQGIKEALENCYGCASLDDIRKDPEVDEIAPWDILKYADKLAEGEV